MARQTKPRQLKRALKILELDGNAYPDLYRTVQEKLLQLDPAFKAHLQRNQAVDPEVE